MKKKIIKKDRFVVIVNKNLLEKINLLVTF